MENLNFTWCSRAALDPLAGRVFETPALDHKFRNSNWKKNLNRSFFRIFCCCNDPDGCFLTRLHWFATIERNFLNARKETIAFTGTVIWGQMGGTDHIVTFPCVPLGPPPHKQMTNRFVRTYFFGPKKFGSQLKRGKKTVILKFIIPDLNYIKVSWQKINTLPLG